MKFNLQNLNQGTWFPLEDNKENGAKICLRVCDGDALRDIFKKTTKNRVEFKNGQRYSYEENDTDLRSALIWDYCIVGWENFTNENDEPISCSKEMKLLLMGKSVVFANFVSEKINELNANQSKVITED